MSYRSRTRRARRRQKRGVLKGLLLILAIGAGSTLGLLAVGTAVAYHYYQGCSLNDLKPVNLGQNSFVYAANGSSLGVIPSVHNRQPVVLKSVSPWLPKATVAIEDRRFYSNSGVDLRSIARAAWVDLRSGQTLQGGSTLTQQLVRNLYSGENQHTFTRKLKEACLAIKLTRRWSKDRIITAYLNQVYYGAHAYGVEAASQTYFSHPASELTLAEAAMIAGLPQSPSLYDPFYHPTAARERRDQVLEAMAAQGLVTLSVARQAEREQLGLRPGKVYASIKEPLFFNFVYDQLVERYGAKTVSEGGLKVTTTLDQRLESLAYKSIRQNLYDKTDPAGALVSIDPRSGEIRAMAAWVPGVKQQPVFNLAAQGKRQAGSSFKVFALAAAISRGIDPFHTYYLSAPLSFPDPSSKGGVWQVHTDTYSYTGPTSLANALVQSDNTVYARLSLDLGPQTIAAMAHRLGVVSPLKAVPSIVLGTNPVSPLEMASGYATIDAEGLYRKPTAIRTVTFPDGKTESFVKAKPTRVLSPQEAYAEIQIMQQVVQWGTGTRAQIAGYKVAGKTGTTSSFTDGWFVGFVPQLATASWVGYPQANIPMTSVHGIQVFGGTIPAQIWHDYMQPAVSVWPAADWHYQSAPNYHYWRGTYQYGAVGYGYQSSPSTSTSTATSTATTTTSATTTPAPKPTPTVKPTTTPTPAPPQSTPNPTPTLTTTPGPGTP